MKKLCILSTCLLASVYCHAQLQIGAGTSWKSEAGTYVVLDNIDLQHDASSAILDNIFKFTGNKNVAVSGTNVPLFSNIQVALTGSSKIILQRTINVSQAITFQSGFLDLNNNNIDLGTSGSVNGESEMTGVTGTNGGYLQIVNTLNAPVSIDPGNLGAIITSVQNLGSTVIRRGHVAQNIAGSGGAGILRYYDISPANNSGLNATLRFGYLNTELNGLDANSLVLWRSPDGLSWSDAGFTTRNTASNYIEKTGIDAFSTWTLARVSNPLPVIFSLFNAGCENGNVKLTWETAQEINSSYFNVERSAGGSGWAVVDRQPAAGNSSIERSYSFTDNSPLANSAAYRIAEYDLNGGIKYSGSIHADCDADKDWKVWPNPVAKNLTAIINVAKESKAVIKIFDNKGSMISLQQINLLKGNNLVHINMNNIASGTYRVIASWSNGQIEKKVTIVKL
ncbi:T9SS type A sorting domain-containing protein [Ferruginibacter paludis]|uniref:T9SS type A sorting domain-containing protein n=1 Tax=Ferruginibacter paludis TaxID=1310417 RepID=UPI0025B589B5|nr:T9SS type A sorting domain-containing protein [Ferruginibacter paludis]MDN3659489.1 T9SS type A sorting domain-containing protein [Ferruginibacter paludis]